jgi:hypothetical protein
MTAGTRTLIREEEGKGKGDATVLIKMNEG